MEGECDVLEASSTRLSFFLFLYYAYSIVLNDRLCRIYLFFSSAALFNVLTARCWQQNVIDIFLSIN